MANAVDARGLSCPQPVILTMRALEKSSSCVVTVDNETAVQNITRFCESRGKKVSVKEDGEDFVLTIG